jgi:hypothetical protein
VRLAEARTFALSLPEAASAPHFDFESFRVRGRIFATAPPDGKHLHVLVGDDEIEVAVALYPKWCEKLWWGRKVLGVRVTLAPAKPAEVRRLLRAAWERRAPKSLRDRS